VVCPVCRYAAPASSFSNPLPAKTVSQLSAAFSKLPSFEGDFGQERNLEQALQSFQLAVRTAQLKREAAGQLASLILACAWIAREMENQELENKYLQEALNFFIKSYQEDSSGVGKLDDMKAAYLIGELHLRLGMYNEAVKWFGTVISHPRIKNNAALEKMTRDQWALARDLAKQNPNQEIPEIAVAKTENKENVKDKKAENWAARKETAIKKSKRVTMQTNLHLYEDQIKWLNQIVNQAYNAHKSLITKEEVVRALLDALMELTADDLPNSFKNESELKQTVIAYLKNIPAKK